MAYLTTSTDPDAEDEAFRVTATSDGKGDFGKVSAVNKDSTIDDAQEQVYELQLPVALASSEEIKEGNGDEIVNMDLVVSPARTVAKSFVFG